MSSKQSSKFPKVLASKINSLKQNNSLWFGQINEHSVRVDWTIFANWQRQAAVNSNRFTRHAKYRVTTLVPLFV